jgi:hypothetical protein
MEGHLPKDPSQWQSFQVRVVNYRKTSRLEAKRSKLTDQIRSNNQSCKLPPSIDLLALDL